MFELSFGNYIVVHPEVYQTPILDYPSIYEFIWNEFSRDATTAVMGVLSKYGNGYFFDIDEIDKKSIYTPEESECHVLVVVNQSGSGSNSGLDYMSFDKYTLVYDKDSWTVLRRQMLGNHPDSSSNFEAGCRDLFSNIDFGKESFADIEDCWSLMPRQIVNNLACLNDQFVAFYENYPGGKDFKSVVADFCCAFNFSKIASPQGSKTAKEEYTFADSTGQFRSCGHHFKINKVDSNCRIDDGQHHQKHCRIHFNYLASPAENQKKIFVGKILHHL